MLSDVRIWSVARTDAEINANKNQRLFGNEAGLAAYWKLNEGTGTSASDSTSSALHG